MLFFQNLYVTIQNSSQVSNLLFRAENLEKDIADLEQTQKEKILMWGNTLQELCLLGHFDFPLDQISSYMRKRMKAAGKSDGFLDYISQVCPAEWKNENMDQKSLVNSANQNQWSQKHLGQKLLTFDKKEFSKLSKSEKLLEYQELQNEAKELRRRMKDCKEITESILVQDGVKISETKFSAGYPPDQYWSEESAYYKELQKTIILLEELKDDFEDWADLVKKFPPNPELDQKCVRNHKPFNQFFLPTLHKLLIPAHDEKWSATHYQWYSIKTDNFWHGKHAAAVMNAIETGEYKTKLVNGKTMQIPIKRPFTREQIGDKEPELNDLMREIIMYGGIFKAIEDQFTEAEVIVKE